MNLRSRDKGEWDRLETDEMKANKDLRRFLLEKYLSARFRGGEVVVLKKYEGFELYRVAPVRDLCYESVDAPMNPNGTRPEFEKWIVIGLDRSKVDEEVQRIRREGCRVRQNALEVAGRVTAVLHEAVVNNAKNSVRMDEWDVAGTWTIRCPKFESKWNVGMNGKNDLIDLTLTTQFFSQSSSRAEQLYAYYDFNITEGLFPLMKVTPWPRHIGDETDSEDDDRQHDGDDGDDDDESVRGLSQEQIYFHPFCSISFRGECCTELSGVLYSHFTGWVEFTGLKTGPSELNPPVEGWEDPDDD